MEETTIHEIVGRANLNEAVARQHSLLAQYVTELAANEAVVEHDAVHFTTHHPLTIAQQDEYLDATGYYFSPSGL